MGGRGPRAFGVEGTAGLVCRSSTGLGETETLLLAFTALGPKEKQKLHKNLGQTYLRISSESRRQLWLHTAASNHTQRQSPTHRSDKNQLHPPVGRHLSLPSGSLQPDPVPTSATKGHTSEEATTLLPAKMIPQKKICMKRQRIMTQIKEKKKKTQLNDKEITDLHEKD